MSIRDFIDELSEEQREAACFTSDPVLALAGAGSGKTRTLMGRFAYLVAPEELGGLGADPGSVMMVTFTNKAAREMRERIEPILNELREMDPDGGYSTGTPWIGTFHGLSLRILRIEADKAGLGRNFSIFDESDARSLANDVVEEMEIDPFDVDEFFRDLETAKARMLAPEFLVAGMEKIEDGKDPSTPEYKRWKKILAHFESDNFVQIYQRYQAALQEQNAVDFNDLLNRTTRLFQQSEDVRNSWRSTFRHFMVDEVQDINRAQVAWLQAITDGGREMAIPEGARTSDYGNAEDGMHEVNTYRIRKFPRPTIACVGDDKQSIYAFRGSEVEVMKGLDQRLPGLTTKFLKTSYRCQPAVLSASNALIGHNLGQFKMEVVPHDGAKHIGAVKIRNLTTPDDEIRHIAKEAEAYLADGGDPTQFAVLTRTRDLAKAVAKVLRANGLPVVEGKSSDLRKTAEVKDVMGFVAYLSNQDAEVPLRRIINKPSRGLGPTSLRKVIQNARLKNTSFLEELGTVMNNRIEVPNEGEGYPKRFVESARAFGVMMSDLSYRISQAPTARDGLMEVLRCTGYLDDMYKNALKSAGLGKHTAEVTSLEPREFLKWVLKHNIDSNTKERVQDQMLEGEDLADRAGQLSEAARRIGNISLLLDETDGFETLEAFAQESVLEMNQAQTPSGIQVMTVHGSKGLEFEHVRLPFWLEGIMPHGRATEGGDAEIEEERRLAYVAITRGARTVEISKSWNVRNCPFIRVRRTQDSRFLDEVKSAGWKNAQFLKKGDGSFTYLQSPPDPEEVRLRKREEKLKSEKADTGSTRPVPRDLPPVAPASAQESELDLVPEGYDPGMSDPGAEYGQDVGYEEQFANQPPLDAYEDAYSGEMPELPPLEAYEQDLDSSPDEENTPVPF
jgi:DNA helicase-2/ATP-dependent DNA helicase PcrA